MDFMKEAIQESKKNLATGDGGPFGAVIVKDGVIVGRGHNEVLVNHDPTCHGEMQAIRNACQNLGTHDLTGCELYTSAEPCPMCLSAIIWANIKTVYYGNSAQDAAAIGFRDDFIYNYIENGRQDADTLTLTQINREEAITVFKDYAAKHMTLY
ncbi:MAG: nucleoside deaminase [Megasphaera sp.]|jgi:tRNA(Arg) A34 adenosine deaminase TadA|nr:nucleoside deaminase [Megasphaera sp.]MCH4187291.1 nucleoside deaminase [Megasphaera sp.]MCH4217257.1 nucleoside deaminase [Megasphaera sp.]